jgi:hypothetical protein
MNDAVSTPTNPHQGTPGSRDQPAARIAPADAEPPLYRGAEEVPPIWAILGFMLVQIAIFLVMVLIHFGLLIEGYRHQNAGATESLLTAVLVTGLLLTWTPRWSHRAAVVAQSFGTMGVLLGLFTIAVGIGPRTILDLTLNGALLVTLIAGLVMMLRRP